MYKPKFGKRKGQAPSITVPRTISQITYLNIPLVNYLKEKGIDSLDISVDKINKEIKLRQAKKGEKGYKVISTGLRGFGVTPRLRRDLPAGRYVLTDKRRMLFKKEV